MCFNIVQIERCGYVERWKVGDGESERDVREERERERGWRGRGRESEGGEGEGGESYRVEDREQGANEGGEGVVQ